MDISQEQSWVVKEDLHGHADPDAEFLWNWALHLHRRAWKSMCNLEREMNSALKLILMVEKFKFTILTQSNTHGRARST